MTAVELPVHLKVALADYPQCEARIARAPGIIERCAKPSEWAFRCIHCGYADLLCEEHATRTKGWQKTTSCFGCGKRGLVWVGWAFIRLRCAS